jgi:putative serine protease PepD
MPRRTSLRPGFAIVAAALVGAATGAGAYALLDSGGTTVVRQVTVDNGASTAASSATQAPSQVYTKAAASVVELTVSSAGSGFGPDGDGGTAQGSGFVYDRQGHVVTNAHVVDGANTVSVRFSNGRTYDATVVGTDSSSDLAVLKVDAPASALRPLALADSSRVVVGQAVVAIGSPFGLEGSLTSGIVSALHRQMTAPNGFAIDDSIQTDAAINHGNSGGPLLDLGGRVVGVNAQIESDSGGNDGVGFAIPSNTVRSVVGQLIGGGQVRYAYLGVSVDTATGTTTGATLTSVRDGTPAADAGLQEGDVVVAIDDRTIQTADQLRSAVADKQPGEQLTLTYVRDGERKTATVKLAERPS